MDFTPNGSNFIYSPHRNLTINTLMLNMPDLSSNRNISNTIFSINAIDIHPDGTQMIRCGLNAFEIVNLTTNATIHRVNDTSVSFFYDCKFSSQGDYAVTYSYRRVTVYNSSNIKIYELNDTTNSPFSRKIDWSSNGNQLIFGYRNTTTGVRGLYVWNKITNIT